tara:strand:- start:355 stop:603 length:249 start_codon:yes stop_codon:yes gene_type:complete
MTNLQFTEKTLSNFDINMDSIGYQYEGSLHGIWIYKNKEDKEIQIVIGNGGVIGAIINRCFNINMKLINSQPKLFKTIKYYL